jgi:hypothetical protein
MNKWTLNVADKSEMRNGHKFQGKKFKEWSNFEDRCSRDNNIKSDLRETGFEFVNSI